ncbi:symmetrical bis(5'-nucleosyl)-tetraphosphatase [Inhella sp.]|uniref:symmetrical bis(5'-nucleosyl)-tetraphosphatase n=1 Tax=Inhella sp. TaxID=1921806 RepID=UPI0035B220C3
MKWLIGDIQGCDGALGRLLDALGFSPSRDELFCLGDLVNRGPDSAATLRQLMRLGARSVLGNHDLHLLAVAAGVRPQHASDTLDGLLAAPDAEALLDWLRAQPLTLEVEGWLLVHAGLLPAWDRVQALQLGAELQALMAGPGWKAFLPHMYGNQPDAWHEGLQGFDRWRVVINACTRLRFVTPQGSMDFKTKEGAEAAPAGHRPWFDIEGRRSAGQPIAFGHWSTLGLINRPDLLALDTGCVWGGCLTAVRIDGGRREVVQVRCDQAQVPGTV